MKKTKAKEGESRKEAGDEILEVVVIMSSAILNTHVQMIREASSLFRLLILIPAQPLWQN